MTIGKAIELLQSNNPPVMDSWCEELTQAVSLGIEALKRVYNSRQRHPPLPFVPLSGETKEK